MQVTSVSHTDPTSSRFAQAANRAGGVVGLGGTAGPLTHSDLTMLKEVTGKDFQWPPQQDQIVPLAAIELAAHRQEQMRSNVAVKDITSLELQALKRSGLLDPDFADAAVDHLEKGRSCRASTSAATMAPPRGVQPAVEPSGWERLYL